MPAFLQVKTLQAGLPPVPILLLILKLKTSKKIITGYAFLLNYCSYILFISDVTGKPRDEGLG